MPDWQALRAEFPLLAKYIYFNACSLGPLPRSGQAALPRSAQDWDEQGTPVWFSTWLPLLERFRGRVAELLRAPAGSTAIAPSVSVALTTLATGLPLPPGRDKVVIGGLDFPTVGHQWLSRPGFEGDFRPSAGGMTIPPGAFAERIDSRTPLVATTPLLHPAGAGLRRRCPPPGDGNVGDRLPLRGAGRAGARARGGRGEHPGAPARPDRPHPGAVRRGGGEDVHPARARAPLRHRDPGV